MLSLFEILKQRMFQSILWTRQVILAEIDINDANVSLQLVLNNIEDGYNYGLSRETIMSQSNFLDRLTLVGNLITN